MGRAGVYPRPHQGQSAAEDCADHSGSTQSGGRVVEGKGGGARADLSDRPPATARAQAIVRAHLTR